MNKPESRRFTSAGHPSRNTPPPQPKLQLPGAPPAPSGPPRKTTRIPTGKTTRITPRTTRRAAGALEGDEGAEALEAAAQEKKAKNQLVLFGAIGGALVLLIIVIAIAASTGGSSYTPAYSAPRAERRVSAAPPPPPPRESPREYNFVRNTGSIVFICGGSDKHADKEVVISACPKCSKKSSYAWDDTARSYRCAGCSAAYENADIKCDECGKLPRVTHLKKTVVKP